MATLIAGVVAVILLYSLLQMFRAANPAVLARAVKIIGGVLALAVAAFTGIRGELAVAVGISQNYLSEIETGRRKGPAELQKKFARALGVPMDLLID